MGGRAQAKERERTTYASDQTQKRWGYPGQDLSDRPPEKALRPEGGSSVFLVVATDQDKKNKTGHKKRQARTFTFALSGQIHQQPPREPS